MEDDSKRNRITTTFRPPNSHRPVRRLVIFLAAILLEASTSIPAVSIWTHQTHTVANSYRHDARASTRTEPRIKSFDQAGRALETERITDTENGLMFASI